MKRFVKLLDELRAAQERVEQTSRLVAYFGSVPDAEKTAALHFLYGLRSPVRLSVALLRQWALEQSGIPDWLLTESLKVAGDTAETLALVLGGTGNEENRSLEYLATQLGEVRQMNAAARKAWVLQAWRELGPDERYVLNKLLAGTFRSPVAPGVLAASISQLTGNAPSLINWRLHRDKTAPGGISYPALAAAETPADVHALPYPFSDAPQEIPSRTPSAHRSAGAAAGFSAIHWLRTHLGSAADWHAELQWAGIPAQLIRRKQSSHIWAAVGETTDSTLADRRSLHKGGLFPELVTGYFPELPSFIDQLPEGTVLEGALLSRSAERLLPAYDLEKRIGRKSIPKSLLRRVPAVFLATDCLEFQSRDIRTRPWEERRQLLAGLTSAEHASVPLAAQVRFHTWEQLAAAHDQLREAGAAGLLLASENIPRPGVPAETRWLWKAAPYTFRGVLLYVRERGKEGEEARFTLGAWEKGKLLSFTTVTALSGPGESEAIADYIRENTAERAGPVKIVTPGLVFEIAFDDISRSPRHRCGLRLHNPGILRWLKDAAPEEAGMLQSLRRLCGEQ